MCKFNLRTELLHLYLMKAGTGLVVVNVRAVYEIESRRETIVFGNEYEQFEKPNTIVVLLF